MLLVVTETGAAINVFEGITMVTQPNKGTNGPKLSSDETHRSRSNHGTTPPPSVPDGWLWLGQVGRPHGVRGAFFLKTQDNRVEWPGYTSVSVGSTQDAARPVEKAYVSGGKLALHLSGMTTREHAEELYNTHLYVSRDQVDLAQSEYLVVDIVGCRVFVEGRAAEFGEVVAVHDFGAQETLEIRPTEAGRETVFFPFTDTFIVEFDPAQKVIVIRDEPVFLDEGT